MKFHLKLSVYFILLLVVTQQLNDQYLKYINTIDPQAKCLDGSPSMFYYHQGSQPDKFLIYLRGGGQCGGNSYEQALQNCYQRSQTFLGSSIYWSQTFNTTGLGYLDTDPHKNKFAEWSKFYFIYCDGSMHQGYTKQPIQYKNTSLYFRGASITRGHFEYLNKKYKLFSGKKIVLTGASAGGLATSLWSSYLRNKLENPNSLVTIADSGIFLDYYSYKAGRRVLADHLVNLYKLSNQDESSPIQKCNKIYPNQEWKCFFFENIYQFLEGPFLVVNSDYDGYVIKNFLAQPCASQGKVMQTLKQCSYDDMLQIQDYRASYRKLIYLYMYNSKLNSIWSVSCSDHILASVQGLYDNQAIQVPQLRGYKIKQAIQNFVFNNERIIKIDKAAWPKNRPCAY